MPSSIERIFLTRAQVREIDRRSVEQYRIPSIVLMENAARGATDVLMKMIGSPAARVLIVCGSGNNAGDGLAIARLAHNRGLDVEIVIASDRFSGDALINWNVVQAMEIKTSHAEYGIERIRKENADLLVDALFGTGLSRAPEGMFATLIDRMNESDVPILAIDIPSGLDCDTGEPLGPVVLATKTVTFVAEKTGFKNPVARRFLGEVTVADIGCPIELIDAIVRT